VSVMNALVTMILALALMGSVSTIPVADHHLMISGVLTVAEQDMHGVPKALELDSPELGRFRVASDGHGRRLFPHAGKWVTVTGIVEMENGARVVHVESFRLLELRSGSRPANAV